MIDLTQELISGKGAGAVAASGSGESEVAAVTASEVTNQQPEYSWKVGDQCMAVYSEDGQ